jgi:hypothetical protein
MKEIKKAVVILQHLYKILGEQSKLVVVNK